MWRESTGEAMRKSVRIVFASVAMFAASAAAAQPGWKPDKPIELIVTCQPGCGPDIAVRNIQKIWQEHKIVSVPSIIVNKAATCRSCRHRSAYGWDRRKRDRCASSPSADPSAWAVSSPKREIQPP
jgi:hypothetical protein